MKTRNDYTAEQMEMIVEHCQPEYCSWVGEWMEENDESEINEYNVFGYLNDNIENVDEYIRMNIFDEEV
jgi:hypothetical protein